MLEKLRPAALVLGLFAIAVGCSSLISEAASPGSPPTKRQESFDELLQRYDGLTAEKLLASAAPRQYLPKLSFDPLDAAFYGTVVQRLGMTESEQRRLRETGFVSIDHGQRYSFGSMYFSIYTCDLPVLVTTDSILHAMHRSYVDLMKEIEGSYFAATLADVLKSCHDELGKAWFLRGDARKSYQDVDLYLTVARNLLEGAGAPEGPQNHPHIDAWDGALLVHSQLKQDDAALKILKLVQSHHMQSLAQRDVMEIYGGERAIDFSQFKPRGHYAESPHLSRYFRAMMWLGRADTGWNVLPVDPQSGLVSDSSRELRNCVLLTQLLKSSGANVRLDRMDAILDFLVGASDNLTPGQMELLLERRKIDDLRDVSSAEAIAGLQEVLARGEFGSQQIRSQVLLSNPLAEQSVGAPNLFQMFGQRFVIDSFVLANVVFDKIKFDKIKVERMMPTGLDVAAALGNDAALPLLSEELEAWRYAPNMAACREYVARQPTAVWQSNLYNVWLDALRQLDDEPPLEGAFPEVMRTEAWQRKQLQTQLASWSELRHDTILYAKQSYTSEVMCEYPTGYVEPYPEVYARIKFFAEQGAELIAAADYTVPGPSGPRLAELQRRQVEFLRKMAATTGELEKLARKELAAEPFTAEEQAWLKKVIDARGGGSGPPRYDGWYCDLFYGGGRRASEWDPTVIDVHTDPNTREALEVGVGSCNFLVAAIDNEDDRMIYVGPAYSYYEFRHPAEKRLTDNDWQQLLDTEKEPPRPTWVDSFQMPREKRELPKISAQRR